MKEETIFITQEEWEQEHEEKKPNEEGNFLDNYYPFFIIFGILAILIAGAFAFYNEFYTPGEFCESVEQKHIYEFSLSEPKHFCEFNGETHQIFQYTNGWDFDRNALLNLSNLAQ